MRTTQYTLTDAQVHVHAESLCQKHIPLRDDRRRCKPRLLWSVLLYAAARMTSLAAACAALRDAPSDPGARDALLASLPAAAELQRRINRALQGDLPRRLRRRPQPLAVDLTLLPYHGRHLHDPAEVYRGQAQDGTTHFHAYATAYVVRQGRRFTLALTAVKRGQPLREVVRYLLQQAARAGVRPRYLLLDRGFCSVDVLRHLQAARRPFLMPLPLRGLAAAPPRGPSGSRVFAYWRRSGWARYTLRNGAGRTAAVAVCEVLQPAWAAGPAGPAGAGVRLRGGTAAGVVRVGAADLPESLRDRDRLPADEPGAHPDEHARPAAAAVVRGRRLGPAQRVGLAALAGDRAAASRGPAAGPGRLELAEDVAVDSALGRGVVGGASRNHHRTPDLAM